RKLLKFLRGAYAAGVPGMMAKPSTDLLANTGGYAFHYGCPNPELRDIASWVLTSGEGQHRRVAKLIPALWKRHGQEDLVMVGLLLANMSEEELGDSPWIALIHMLGESEPLGALLEIGEEMLRGGHEIPDDEWIMAMAGQSKLWHQVAVLFLSLRAEKLGSVRGVVTTAPGGGELFERIRNRLLSQEN
ncbi:hypothetical protein N9O16_06185, partial [Candidatus Poseidoniaceae archaeon]|nr:hypothetical protein [Candidatus Poseidoniaceae archaeon]